ncbi:MAG: hypothetical protein ACOH2E_02140 [Candidatus Paracaedibacter sp.]
MSIKTILVLTSLSLILSSQHTMVQAAYPPSGIVEQHDIEAAQSMKSMKPLLDHNQEIVPLSKFEPKSSMKNFTLTTQEALDKQEIAGMSASSLVSTELQDEITNYQFARRIGFTFIGMIAEEQRNSLKMESLVGEVAKNLENFVFKTVGSQRFGKAAQEVPALKGASFLYNELWDEISIYQFAKRVYFAYSKTTEAEVTANSLKKESWLESIEKYLEKVAPYLDNYGRSNLLD